MWIYETLSHCLTFVYGAIKSQLKFNSLVPAAATATAAARMRNKRPISFIHTKTRIQCIYYTSHELTARSYSLTLTLSL